MLGRQWSCFNQVHRVHLPPRKASGAMAAVSTIVRLQTSGDLSRPGQGDEDDIRQNVRLCMYVERMGSVSRAWSMATGKSCLPHDPHGRNHPPEIQKSHSCADLPSSGFARCIRPLTQHAQTWALRFTISVAPHYGHSGQYGELVARANCFLLTHYSRFSESWIQPGANR